MNSVYNQKAMRIFISQLNTFKYVLKFVDQNYPLLKRLSERLK